MQKIIVDAIDPNTKIERYILSIYPSLSYGTLQKTFRKKDIKVNGKRVDRDYIIKTGDVIEIYIKDDLLNGSANKPLFPGNNATNSGNTQNSSAVIFGGQMSTRNDSVNLPGNPDNVIAIFTKYGTARQNIGFTVVYEDNNILIVNKAQGVPVHPDKDQSKNTLIDQVRLYLSFRNSQVGENCPPDKNCPPGENCPPKGSFQPSLCHRLDRNTGGLVIIAKNQESYDVLLKKIEAREIRKYYKCLVKGRMEKSKSLLKAYLWKDARKSIVYVSSQKSKGAQEVYTAYKVLEYDPSIDVSMLEVELLTGRTHQIRAHLSFAGHPILGDGKYGTNTLNRMFRLKKQALWAYKLEFCFKGESHLDYLNGRVFAVEPDFDVKSLKPDQK